LGAIAHALIRPQREEKQIVGKGEEKTTRLRPARGNTAARMKCRRKSYRRVYLVQFT
jgi:hypothetical protein